MRYVLSLIVVAMMVAGASCQSSEPTDSGQPPSQISAIVAVCGDGVVSLGEACDLGSANSDTVRDACRRTCQWAHCGDGVVDTGEACDDGEANSDTTPGACRTTCQLPKTTSRKASVMTGTRCSSEKRMTPFKNVLSMWLVFDQCWCPAWGSGALV